MLRIPAAITAVTLLSCCSDTDEGKDDDLTTTVPSNDDGAPANGDDDGGADGSTSTDLVGLPPCRSAEGHATTIDAVADTTDGILQMQVSYGGGCETHFFELCWPEPAFMESAPVQASLELLHTGEEDFCERWVTERVELDVSPMADAWRDAYGGSSGEMILNIQGHSTLYTF